MRIGYSWAVGHGRRMWVSMPFWAWVAAGFFLWPVFLAVVGVALVLWLLLAVADGSVKAYRWWRARRAPGWAKRPLKP